MSKLRKRFIEDLRLRGHADSTVEAYVHAVADLARYLKRSPAHAREEDVRRYFIHLSEERKLAESSIRQRRYGLLLFFGMTIKRPMQILKQVQVRVSKKLPVILNRSEVRAILRHVKQPVSRMCLMTIYSCGLRISEALSLQKDSIDGERKMLRVEQGKGNRDRYIPLPERTLTLLREYWESSRPPGTAYLFPGRRDYPLTPTTVQRAIKLAAAQANISKAVTTHSLRHSYATHLLEAGVDIRTIQQFLGHKSVDTTMIYTHVTEQSQIDARGVLDILMADL